MKLGKGSQVDEGGTLLVARQDSRSVGSQFPSWTKQPFTFLIDANFSSTALEARRSPEPELSWAKRLSRSSDCCRRRQRSAVC